MLNDDNRADITKRLNRIAGQVQGIQRMVDDDRYCVDILTQIAAARAALGKVSNQVLEAHLDTCVVTSFASGNENDREAKVRELLDVFGRYMSK